MAADPSSFRRARTAIVVCITLALIVSPAVVAVAAVGGGGTASAAAGLQSIEPGTEYEGTVGGNQSADRYTFSAQEGEHLRVTTYSGSPDQVEATLYGPSGDRLGGHEVYVEYIGFGAQAPESGQYTVEFTSDSPYEHDYRFEVETASDDGVGDTRSAARSLGDSSERAVLGEGDEDYWAVEVPRAGDLSVDVDNERIIGAGVAVEVVSPDGDVLARSETNCAPGSDPCDIPELTVDAQSSGQYYVHVVDDGVPGFNRYSVSAEAPEGSTGTGTESGEETRRIAISSDGERINYEFDVTGSVRTVDTDTEESVSGDHAEGVVVDGTDVFEFTGEVTDFSADGDPAVEIDGESVDPDSFGGTAGGATETDEETPTETETATPTPTETSPTESDSDGDSAGGDARDGETATVGTEGKPTPTEGSGDAAPTDAETATVGTEEATATATPAATATPTLTSTPTSTDADAATTEASDDAGPSMPENGTTESASGDGGEGNGSIRDLDETTEGTSTGDGPGFGPVAALVAVLAALGVGLARSPRE